MEKNQLKNIFSNLPANPLNEEIFETLLQNNNVKVERIISTGQITPGDKWYDQEQDEWVILLKGQATLLLENESEVNLESGDYIFIKAHQKHKVTWTSPDEACVWLALHVNAEKNKTK